MAGLYDTNHHSYSLDILYDADDPYGIDNLLDWFCYASCGICALCVECTIIMWLRFVRVLDGIFMVDNFKWFGPVERGQNTTEMQ